MYYKCGDMDLAEDLIQEVFIKVWEKREDIKMDSVKSLLYTVASNLLINHYKHQQVVTGHQAEQGMSESSEYQSPQFQMEEQEFADRLNGCIEKLPEGCREVFLMNRIDKLKYAEIAERLELSVKAVEKRMSRAIGILKEELGVKL